VVAGLKSAIRRENVPYIVGEDEKHGVYIVRTVTESLEPGRRSARRFGSSSTGVRFGACQSDHAGDGDGGGWS
jgi:hypothetical protein